VAVRRDRNLEKGQGLYTASRRRRRSGGSLAALSGGGGRVLPENRRPGKNSRRHARRKDAVM